MKQLLGTILGNLTVFAGLVLGASVLIYFIWNTAVIWAVPTLGAMGFLPALGIAALFVLVNNIAHFWMAQVKEVNQAKALASLNAMSMLNADLAFVKTVLYEKGILTNEDYEVLNQAYGLEDAQ